MVDLGAAAGAVPAGGTVFGDEIPAVANLDLACSVPSAKLQLMPRATGSRPTSGCPPHMYADPSHHPSHAVASKGPMSTASPDT
jgi:hypothetical protein